VTEGRKINLEHWRRSEENSGDKNTGRGYCQMVLGKETLDAYENEMDRRQSDCWWSCGSNDEKDQLNTKKMRKIRGQQRSSIPSRPDGAVA
jgi:hypothetical protein